MRHILIALGLCLSIGIVSSPLIAAEGNGGSAAHQAMLAKGKRSKSKFKPRKAKKVHPRRANRAN